MKWHTLKARIDFYLDLFCQVKNEIFAHHTLLLKKQNGKCIYFVHFCRLLLFCQFSDKIKSKEHQMFLVCHWFMSVCHFLGCVCDSHLSLYIPDHPAYPRANATRLCRWY